MKTKCQETKRRVCIFAGCSKKKKKKKTDKSPETEEKRTESLQKWNQHSFHFFKAETETKQKIPAVTFVQRNSTTATSCDSLTSPVVDVVIWLAVRMSCVVQWDSVLFVRISGTDLVFLPGCPFVKPVWLLHHFSPWEGETDVFWPRSCTCRRCRPGGPPTPWPHTHTFDLITWRVLDYHVMGVLAFTLSQRKLACSAQRKRVRPRGWTRSCLLGSRWRYCRPRPRTASLVFALIEPLVVADLSFWSERRAQTRKLEIWPIGGKVAPNCCPKPPILAICAWFVWGKATPLLACFRYWFWTWTGNGTVALRSLHSFPKKKKKKKKILRRRLSAAEIVRALRTLPQLLQESLRLLPCWSQLGERGGSLQVNPVTYVHPNPCNQWSFLGTTHTRDKDSSTVLSASAHFSSVQYIHLLFIETHTKERVVMVVTIALLSFVDCPSHASGAAFYSFWWCIEEKSLNEQKEISLFCQKAWSWEKFQQMFSSFVSRSPKRVSCEIELFTAGNCACVT